MPHLLMRIPLIPILKRIIFVNVMKINEINRFLYYISIIYRTNIILLSFSSIPVCFTQVGKCSSFYYSLFYQVFSITENILTDASTLNECGHADFFSYSCFLSRIHRR